MRQAIVRLSILLLLLLTVRAAIGQATRNIVRLNHSAVARSVVVTVDGKPFTAYIYPGPAVLKKPVLYPILSAGGNPITRGWPLKPRPGERVDHPHQVGLWFNYGDVNGHDFWNNSGAIGPEHKGPFGTIVHSGIRGMKNGRGKGELRVRANWLDSAGKPMLRETTRFVFRAGPGERTIDRITTLLALDKDIVFRDNKEGLIAVRVARPLEQPSAKPDVFTDAAGQATVVPVLDNNGVTGNYVSSEGAAGDAVWGTRARWVNLTGTVGGEQVSVVLFDHPRNPGYPTHWHARGYGLFAANPLAPRAFSNGQNPAMNTRLAAGQSRTFRHRLLIVSQKLLPTAINKRAAGFGR